jgi:hypothetical protein
MPISLVFVADRPSVYKAVGRGLVGVDQLGVGLADCVEHEGQDFS